jgi:serine-type D-Ala-D-Ala carboxypeptidase/endopeptidase
MKLLPYRTTLLLLLGLLPALLPSSRPAPRPPSYDLSSVTVEMQDAVSMLGLEGASLLLMQHDRVIYERYFGSFTPDTVVPIASGSKLLTAAVIMTLVDEGSLGLDDPIGRYLPDFTGDKAQITVRQLLSHTSGLPGECACLGDDSMTLADCVHEISQLDLIAPPGQVFYYGGVSLQVAGRVAEVVSGKSWAELFAGCLQRSLGMTATTYGQTPNPILAGGVRSTLREYSRFLTMLLDGGSYAGQRILSPATVREMQRDQTGDATILLSLYGDGRRYGLGMWIDTTDDHEGTVQVSCQGDTGFSPWIDLQRDVCGVLLVDDYLGNIDPLIARLQQDVRQAIDQGHRYALPLPSPPPPDQWRPYRGRQQY